MADKSREFVKQVYMGEFIEKCVHLDTFEEINRQLDAQTDNGYGVERIQLGSVEYRYGEPNVKTFY
jgi:hypothetical protein